MSTEFVTISAVNVEITTTPANYEWCESVFVKHPTFPYAVMNTKELYSDECQIIEDLHDKHPEKTFTLLCTFGLSGRRGGYIITDTPITQITTVIDSTAIPDDVLDCIKQLSTVFGDRDFLYIAEREHSKHFESFPDECVSERTLQFLLGLVNHNKTTNTFLFTSDINFWKNPPSYQNKPSSPSFLAN